MAAAVRALACNKSHFHLCGQEMLHDLEDNIEYLTHMEDVVVKDLKKRLRTHDDDDEDLHNIDAIMHKSRNAVDPEYEYVDDDEDDSNEGSGHRTVFIM